MAKKSSRQMRRATTITATLALRMQSLLNEHNDSPPTNRVRPIEAQFTRVEMQAIIAALSFVLLAPGYTR